MNWTKTRVLVTGAGGFIGSHLVERLAALGAGVRAFVHYRGNGSYGWLDESSVKEDIEIVSGDLRDAETVSNAMKHADVVFHLGALIAIPYSYQAPASFVDTNIVGTLHVLQAARAAGAKVIQTSTSETYGTAQYVPMDEAHPLQAQSPYAASKIGADKLVESFARSYQLPAVTIRPFNTYGPRQSARAVIPTIITQCLAGERLKLGNLSPVRDMNFVADTVEGFVLAAATPEAVGRTINLGAGSGVAIGDVARMIMALCGGAVPIEEDAQRVRPKGSEVERLIADNTLAKTVLGWQPAVPLEQGLQQTIAWLREHLAQYRVGTYAR